MITCECDALGGVCDVSGVVGVIRGRNAAGGAGHGWVKSPPPHQMHNAAYLVDAAPLPPPSTTRRLDGGVVFGEAVTLTTRRVQRCVHSGVRVGTARERRGSRTHLYREVDSATI